MDEPHLRAASIGAQPGELSPTSDTRLIIHGARRVSLAGRVGRKENPELGGLSQRQMGDLDSGHRTGKPCQAGGKRCEDLKVRVRAVFGGRTRPVRD